MEKLTPDLKQAICGAAKKYAIDQLFLLALIKAESEFNPYAERYEANYHYYYSVKELAEVVGCSRDTMSSAQMRSVGLMQIMLGVAYERGFRSWPARLHEIELNLCFGCLHLNYLKNRFNLIKDDETLYAAYNHGSPKEKNGEWINQKQVDRFNKCYEEVKAFL